MKDTSTNRIALDLSNQDAKISCGTGLGRKAEMRTLILAERRPVPREFSKTRAGE